MIVAPVIPSASQSMQMESRRGTVCKACLAWLRRSRPSHTNRPLAPFTQHHDASRSSSTTHRSSHVRPGAYVASSSSNMRCARSASTASPVRGPTTTTTTTTTTQSIDLNQLHARIQELSNSALKPSDSPIPSEQRILYVLEQLDSLSLHILDEKPPSGISKPRRPTPLPKQETATSALLGSVNTRTPPPTLTRPALLALISSHAEQILRHPRVFITPAILRSYIDLQSLLSQPSSFPEILELYAHKPAPLPPSSPGSPVTFSAPSPDRISSAIPLEVARAALSAATRAHDLPLALSTITSSLCTRAFRRAKILRQAGLPLAGFAAAPVAAYSLATQFANLQQTMDAHGATGLAFAGIMTYVGAVGAVGYVAVTTANDQMERVTWATGVPLWERWVREEERAAVDAVAMAWGFQEEGRRGEEEGEEWEGFREWVGRRGMVLDRVSLMEGME